MTALATLVIGASAAVRESAIADLIEPGAATALLLEGLPDGVDAFADMPAITVARIAPGCFCCTGNLTMVVTLNRLLRQRPVRLYISIATDTHLPGIEQLLSAAPYDAWLTLTTTLDANNT